MNPLYRIAFVIAFLVTLWVYLTVGHPQLNLNPWIGFVAWAAFFAAGGSKQGAKSSFYAGIVAILLTAITLYGVQTLGGGLVAMMVLLPLLAFVLVIMAQFSSLAYTPGAFLGAANFFGSGGNVDLSIIFILISWVAGICLGLASEKLEKMVARTA